MTRSLCAHRISKFHIFAIHTQKVCRFSFISLFRYCCSVSFFMYLSLSPTLFPSPFCCFPLFSILPLFWRIKEGLWDHLSACLFVRISVLLSVCVSNYCREAYEITLLSVWLCGLCILLRILVFCAITTFLFLSSSCYSVPLFLALVFICFSLLSFFPLRFSFALSRPALFLIDIPFATGLRMTIKQQCVVCRAARIMQTQ
jgi:hypothetical protein